MLSIIVWAIGDILCVIALVEIVTLALAIVVIGIMGSVIPIIGDAILRIFNILKKRKMKGE